MQISKIYDELFEFGLTKSQIHFSTLWLGRSKRYFSHLSAIQREPGLATLCALEWRLRTVATHIGDCDLARHLGDIADELAAHIMRRGIVDLRYRHRAWRRISPHPSPL
ncbi:DUF6626 family protein [Aurantimonas coralicida]|uniref:DUF6626 family protein n=1 Tax=Aurantimonas coralicida TaxID=182270 RepID=UPI003969D215